jgi:hypothetical protein
LVPWLRFQLDSRSAEAEIDIATRIVFSPNPMAMRKNRFRFAVTKVAAFLIDGAQY